MDFSSRRRLLCIAVNIRTNDNFLSSFRSFSKFSHPNLLINVKEIIKNANCVKYTTASTPMTDEANRKNEQKSTNVDKDDVKRHEKVMRVWWNMKGPMKALHHMNRVRGEFIKNGLLNTGKLSQTVYHAYPHHYLKGMKLVDVGCGAGIASEMLGRLGAEVTGIDASEDILSVAREHAKNSAEPFPTELNYVCSNIEDFAKNNSEKFDVVLTSEVLEHVPDKESFLSACVKILKPGGSLFITTPTKSFLSWLGNIVFAEYIIRIVPKQLHDWNSFTTHPEVTAMLEKNNCHTVLVNGLVYNFKDGDWVWTSTTTFHYALHAVKSRS